VIDVNIWLSRWPFRRLPLDETSRLVERLHSLGITQAWAGSFDGLLHRDMADVNRRLAAECALHPDMLIPFGTINPTLPDWREDLRRCHEDHGMPGIRLIPNYHGYNLDDARLAELLDLAGQRRLIVQLVLRMEDDRTHHPLLRVPDVNPEPLTGLIQPRPQLRLVVLNGMRTLRPDSVAQLAQAGSVWFDIGMLEGAAGIEKLLPLVSHERLLLGTYAPFFYPESAVLKLQESELAQIQKHALIDQNARG